MESMDAASVVLKKGIIYVLEYVICNVCESIRYANDESNVRKSILFAMDFTKVKITCG